MADLTVASAVLTWLKAHPSLVDGGATQIPVALDDLPAAGQPGLDGSPTSGPVMMLQSLAGDPYIKRYKSGGHIAAYPFAVYLRQPATDTAARLDAMKLLSDLGDSIDDESGWPAAPAGYDFMSLVLRTTPARVAVDDAGTEDYQATFELIYRKRG
jgi:hypothetical protein